MTLLDFIDSMAQKALQYPQVYFKPGHNGPYFHPETEVRNKGHWLITFCKLYEWTGKEVYKGKAGELAEYLLSQEARPYGYSFYHRNAPKKDRCNGLVGQAWTFEALAQASKTLQDHAFDKLAEKVFLQHSFDNTYSLWNILEIDGKILPIDNAFNHQLWFAAAISMVNSDHPQIRSQVGIFLDKLFENVTVLENGLIYHEFEPEGLYVKAQKTGIRRRIKHQIKQFFMPGQHAVNFTPEEKKEKLWHKMKHKSIGYHAFNTYAFALLKQQYPSHPIWQHPHIENITSYLFSDEYVQGIEDNKFSFAYNPPGFEVPFSLLILKPDMQNFSAFAQKWVNKQLQVCYNKDTGFFDRNNEDALTLTARIYEATRLGRQILGEISINDNLI